MKLDNKLLTWLNAKPWWFRIALVFGVPAASVILASDIANGLAKIIH